jgi:hypothetical protein
MARHESTGATSYGGEHDRDVDTVGHEAQARDVAAQVKRDEVGDERVERGGGHRVADVGVRERCLLGGEAREERSLAG